MARKEVLRTPADKARWLSEYLGTEIDKLPTGDFLKLSYEVRLFLLGWTPLSDYSPEILAEIRPDTDKNRAFLRAIQHGARELLKRIVRMRDDEKTREELGADPVAQFSLKYHVTVSENQLLVDYDQGDYLGAMIFWIVELLSKFTLSSIKTCANEPCGNFFIQTTKREKIYCSQRCAWQQTSRKARRAGGDEYRKKQRKVMRKRYDEGQKKKHGPNVKVNQRKKR